MIRKPSSPIGTCDSYRRHGLLGTGCSLSALICAFYVSGCCAPGAEQVATPTLDPNGGTFTASVDVTIACATDGATIRYTTNGSDPTASSTEYAGPVNLKATTTVKARAFKDGLTDSEVVSAAFTVDPPAGQAAAPTFNPNGGTFTGSVDVAISTTTAGATIRYTTDGSDPDATSTQYTNPVHLAATTTLKARAFKTGLTDSEVGSATFNVNSLPGQVDTPVFDPDGGTFLHSVGVAISSATAGATIRYTTDGSTPTSSQGTVYAGVFQLTASATVNAVAYKSGMADSAVASAAFVVKSTMRVSVKSDTEVEGNADSNYPSISADGRYVAFDSKASNLGFGDFPTIDNGVTDVFVHDRQTGSTTQVSVSSASAQGNNASYHPSISADGRHVAFESLASNLVDDDTNGKWDIFVRDRQTNQTTRVSIDSAEAEANGDSNSPSISADGRYVAFCSTATNLASGDSNGWLDVFVRDRQAGQTTRVSVDSTGAQADGRSWAPSISADGRYVAFASRATNLVDGDSNDKYDVFVHDRQTHETTRVSVQSISGAEGDDQSNYPSVSADGRYVVFSSDATNLGSSEFPTIDNGKRDIFVHDRQTGQTTLVSLGSGSVPGNAHSMHPSISADGRYVAFRSWAYNLVEDDNNGEQDVFVRDRQTNQTTRVSVSSGGAQGNSSSIHAALSGNGRYVAFESRADNLVANDTNNRSDVFVHDRGQ